MLIGAPRFVIDKTRDTEKRGKVFGIFGIDQKLNSAESAQLNIEEGKCEIKDIPEKMMLKVGTTLPKPL